MAAPVIRVLFFTSRLGGGGAEMQMLRVANHLDPEQVAVEVAVARPGGDYERLLAPHVPLHHLAPALIRSSTAALAAAVVPLRKLVRQLRPHVVCSFMDGVSVISALALDDLEPRPRLIACVQNTPTQAYARSSNPIRRLILAAARRVYPRVDAIVALSRGVAADLIHQIPDVASRVEVIYNAGLDDLLPVRAAEPVGLELDPNHHRPLVVACGRLMPQKGYPVLLEAFERLHRDLGAHLWIIGEGPLRRDLERRIAQRGLGNAVRLLGFQRNPFPFMAAADAFVVPSLWEGFGNVIVEAMATGRAVVASDCPFGPGEIIQDGKNGLLVPPGDPIALERDLRRVLTDRELARRLGDAAKQRAQDFHARRIGASYAAFIQRVASRPSAHDAA